MDSRAVAEQIFLAGVESVLPAKLIASHLSLQDNVLVIGQDTFLPDTLKHIYVIGAGKACAKMAEEIEKLLGERITEGHIVVKYGHSCRLKHIRVTEAGHPIPDNNGFKATKEILEIAGKAMQDDLVICLISGGGSALFADYPDGSSPHEIILLNELIINSGAGIKEINAVRKHLSSVKGGQLARAVYPATLICLILSDVPGNHLDVIASGPTTPDPTTYSQAYDVLVNFNLLQSVPSGLIKHLKEGIDGKWDETPKESDPAFLKTTNILVGSNRIALDSAGLKALEYNINPVIIDDQLQGDTVSVAEYIVETASRFKDETIEVKPVCLLFGGETTVRMTGKGSGGRNQHLALLIAGLLKDKPGITVLCAGTDGNDGPTGAAGAVVDSRTTLEASARNLDAGKFISEFDSYHFFRKTGGHIITGPTMTNVMDIIVVIVE